MSKASIKGVSMSIKNNIKDIALIFEGGGMRASYTAGFVSTLLENELYFDYVSGISAGSSHSVNYLSRDINRSKKSFIDLVLDPKFGGWKSYFKGEGYFRSQYIYEETPLPGAALPFDIETFNENPARIRIGAFDRELGQIKYFQKNDLRELSDLMKIVRASSSMPIFMPPTLHQNRYYVDGGLAGGIALDIAKKDGMKQFFVVLTREKGYQKEPLKYGNLLKAYYRKYPKVAEAMLNRHKIYNETLEELKELEVEGKAFLVYPDSMPVSNKETSYEKLCRSYQLGYEQGQKDVPKWKAFLGVDN